MERAARLGLEIRRSRARRGTMTMQSGMKPARARASSRRPAAIRAAMSTMYEPRAMRRTPQGQKATFSGLRSAISGRLQPFRGYSPHKAANGSWQVDELDVTQRHLEESGAELAEGLGVAGAEKPIGPLFIAGLRQSLLLEGTLRRRRDRVSGGHQPDVPAKDALQHGRDQ